MGTKFTGYGAKQPFIILGSDMHGVDKSHEIESSLKSLGLNFRRVFGGYESILGDHILERSFVIPYKDIQSFKSLMGLAYHFEQESILHVTEQRDASLLFMDKDEMHLGKFTPFTKKEFDMLNEQLTRNFTFDGDYYYITVKE